VSALAIGNDDTRSAQGARTRQACDLVELLASMTGTEHPLRLESARSERLVLVELGDVVAVINTGDDDRIAKIRDGERRYSVPVGARRFSALRRSAVPDFALISGVGTLAVDGTELISTPTGVTAVIDGETLRVHPGYSESGVIVRGVCVGEVPLERTVTKHDDFYQGPFPGFPAVLAVTDQAVVARGTASFDRDVQAWPRPSRPNRGVNHQGSDWHTLVAHPDRIQIEWQGSGDDIAIHLVAEDFAADTTTVLRDRLEGAEGRRTYSGYGDITRSRLRLDVVGEQVPDSLVVGIRYLYDDRDLPIRVRSLESEGVSRAHFLHPLKYEGCTVRTTFASYRGPTGWTDANLVIGARGVHGRHLQEGEDWIDVRLT
jgi:hypothetical protein